MAEGGWVPRSPPAISQRSAPTAGRAPCRAVLQSLATIPPVSSTVPGALRDEDRRIAKLLVDLWDAQPRPTIQTCKDFRLSQQAPGRLLVTYREAEKS